MKWITTAILLIMTGCATTRSQWDWVTLMEATHHDESYHKLTNAFLSAGLVPCWNCGYSLHTGTIDVTHNDFARGQAVLIKKTTQDGLTALIRKEWERPIYLNYVNGRCVEERVVDCFKTSGVQGTFSIDQQPDIVWQERMRMEAAEQKNGH